MKYLTHELSPCSIYGLEQFGYKCNICNVILYFSIQGNYYLIRNDINYIESDVFLFTCNEWIIKKIID